MTTASELHPAFMHSSYLFRKKVFKLFGGAFHVYDESGNLALYSKQKAFKLKEDFRVYADERQMEELLVIKTPQILDLGATYYVEDATTSRPVGAMRRKFLASIFKDKWIFLAEDGSEIGELTETSALGALLSRVINIFPQSYKITAATGELVASVKQHFNPFVLKYTMTIHEAEPAIDRRLLIAANILLAAIEGRQQ